MDVLLLSRLQFAVATMFHFLFVPFTLGLSFMVAYMETKYVQTGDETYLAMTKFWGKLFLINFAVGVVTGITLEFQFGTNWSRYSAFVGDIFGSLRCDCGPQLQQAMSMIEEEGNGVLLYIRQEGRGIGLVNKLKAYALQDQGFDTVEANEKLGFKPDMRNYGIGAQILVDLGVRKMRLLTNNPKKMVGLEGYGLSVVDQVTIEVEPNEFNKCYLECKKLKMGHLLNLDATP